MVTSAAVQYYNVMSLKIDNTFVNKQYVEDYKSWF